MNASADPSISPHPRPFRVFMVSEMRAGGFHARRYLHDHQDGLLAFVRSPLGQDLAPREERQIHLRHRASGARRN